MEQQWSPLNYSNILVQYKLLRGLKIGLLVSIILVNSTRGCRVSRSYWLGSQLPVNVWNVRSTFSNSLTRTYYKGGSQYKGGNYKGRATKKHTNYHICDVLHRYHVFSACCIRKNKKAAMSIIYAHMIMTILNIFLIIINNNVKFIINFLSSLRRPNHHHHRWSIASHFRIEAITMQNIIFNICEHRHFLLQLNSTQHTIYLPQISIDFMWQPTLSFKSLALHYILKFHLFFYFYVVSTFSL